MRVTVFEQNPYRHLPADFEQRYNSVVTVPYRELVDRDNMRRDMQAFIDELLFAARLGFDGVALTEHGQSSYDIMPNPNLVATTLAYVTEKEGLDTAITVLGRSLGKCREPLRIAEEYAMIDMISGGRLIAGLPVGLSYDANQNAGIPPIETRDRYFEGRALLEKAWSASAPFAWNGKYFKYPSVSVWPRPYQAKPPFWVPSVGNPQTMADILTRDDVYVYLSWFGAKLTGRRIFDRYWDVADKLGKEKNPYRLAFLQVVAVGETDADAEKEYSAHLQQHFRHGLGSIPLTGMGLPGYIDIRGVQSMMRDPGDLGLVAGLKTATFRDLVDAQVAIVGGPETVTQQITEFVKEFNIGHLLVMLQCGPMPRELTEKNMTLFAERVLPHLRDIWNDRWSVHGWPERRVKHPEAVRT